MSKTISILGATGSIGRQTLDVAEQMGLRVAAITANSSVERMEEQVRQFRPRLAVMTDEAGQKTWLSAWRTRRQRSWGALTP